MWGGMRWRDGEGDGVTVDETFTGGNRIPECCTFRGGSQIYEVVGGCLPADRQKPI